MLNYFQVRPSPNLGDRDAFYAKNGDYLRLDRSSAC